MILFIKGNNMNLITLEYRDIENNSNQELSFSKVLLKEPYKESSLFVVCVDGESMQPMIKHHALVIADLSQKKLINDAIYLVYKDENMWIKKAIKDKDNIDKFLFVSINEAYSHLVFKQDDVHLVAKVLLTFTNL